jgi:hypothetical protein
MLPGWRPLADVAREGAAREGVSERTIKNRLLAIDHALGGGLVRSFQRSGPARKHWVHVGKLEEALRRDPEAQTAGLDWLTSRIERLEQITGAFKRGFRQLRKQVAAAEPATPSEPAKPLPLPLRVVR